MKTIDLKRYEAPIWVLLFFLLIMSAWLDVVLPAESDKGWLLHAARMWLMGRKAYVDIIEVNPPFILWLYALPVWVSIHVPPLKDYQILSALGLSCIALCVWAGVKLICLHPAVTEKLIRRGDFAMLLALVMVLFTTQSLFFDREHIFIVLVFPYMLRFMPSLYRAPVPLYLRLVIGFTAALGFLVKPHTAVVFAVIQLVSMVRERSFAILWSVENCIIYACAALYLAAAVCFMPAYFTVVLPIVFATYSKFGNRSAAMLYEAPFVIAIGLVFSHFRAWHKTPFRREAYYFILLCVALFLYAKSNNGWGYTYNPLLCMMLFTTMWMLWEYTWLKNTHEVQGLPTQQFEFGMRGCMIVLIFNTLYMMAYIAFVAPIAYSGRAICEGQEECMRNNAFAEYAHDNDIHSFGTISYDFSKWISLMHMSGASWDMRFNCLWMLPQLIEENAAPGSKNYWILEYVGKALASDMNNLKPQMMIVDISPGFMSGQRPAGMVSYLSGIAEFKEAWGHYRLDHTVDMCKKNIDYIPTECRYQIYRLVP